MNSNSQTSLPSALYISHGGGPLPLLGDASHREMVDGLKTVATILQRPAAIIVVSAHWEADKVTILGGANPPLLFDYGGFPPEAYTIEYPAPGDSVLAGKIVELLQKDGIEADLTENRGFDHGLFVPLKIMYPEADIPCVQVSLIKGLDPEEHIALGRSLCGLKDENILVLGSGFSFHNMKAFFAPSTTAIELMNESFEQWLMDTCTDGKFTEEEREHRLLHWDKAPAARFCHPREEHLLPLHVCYGFAGKIARRSFSWQVMGKKVSAYLW